MTSTVALTTLAIGPESAVQQPAPGAYTGVQPTDWKVLGKLASLPDIGDGEYESVPNTPINTGVVEKYKGTLDYGEGEIVVTRVEGDPGQMAMLTAFQSSKPFMFKLTLPTGASRFFTANVNSAKQSFGEADDIIKTTYAIAITHAAVEMIPAP